MSPEAVVRDIELRSILALSPLEMAKVILSGADYHPGLWRESPAWEQIRHDERYMKWINFLEMLQLSHKGRRWTKSQWGAAHAHVHRLAYGPKSRGDLQASPSERINASRAAIRRAIRHRFDEARSISLVCVDVETAYESLSPGESYYFMGSVLRFDRDRFRVGYDHVKGTATLDLAVGFDEVSDFVARSFGPRRFSDLFLKAEVVAHVHFSEDDGGRVEAGNFDESAWTRFSFSSPILAAAEREIQSPIRFAQPLAVSDVTRLV